MVTLGRTITRSRHRLSKDGAERAQGLKLVTALVVYIIGWDLPSLSCRKKLVARGLRLSCLMRKVTGGSMQVASAIGMKMMNRRAAGISIVDQVKS